MNPEFIEQMTPEQLQEFLRGNARLHAMVISRRLEQRPPMTLPELLADITLSELMETLDET